MKPHFIIRFTGNEVRPESFTLSDLMDLLRVINSAAKDFLGPAEDCSLVTIKRSSAAYGLCARDIDSGQKLIENLAGCLSLHPEELSQRQRRVRDYFTKTNRAKGCTTNLLDSEHRVIKKYVDVGENTNKELKISEVVTIQGKVVSAGGTGKPKAEILLMDNSRANVYGSEEDIKKLASSLYSGVTIEGLATVSVEDGATNIDEIYNIWPFNPVGIATLFDSLRGEFGDKLGLDDIDPVAFQIHMRE